MEADPIYHLKKEILGLNLKMQEIETDTRDLITRVDKLEGLEGKIDSTIESMEGGLKSNGEEITGLKAKIKFIESILSRMGGKSDRGCMLMAEQADMSSMGGMGPPPGSGPPPAGILGKGVVLGIARSDYLHKKWEEYYPELIEKIKRKIGAGEGAFVADGDLKDIIIETLQEEEKNGNPIVSPEHFEQEKDTLIPKIIDEYRRQIVEAYKIRAVEGAAGGGGKLRKKSKSKKKKKSKNKRSRKSKRKSSKTKRR